MSEYRKLLELTKKYEKIAVFRHTHPDGDAAGSQLGYKCWVQANFPEKDVRALGQETYDIYPYVDQAEDSFLEGALAVILDTSNAARVDDKRFAQAAEVIRIDHHPVVEHFEDHLICEPERPSVCELLADILTEGEYAEYPLTPESAAYLYSGMLTDTLNLSTPGCNGRTMRAAARLADTGIDLSALSVRMFDVPYSEFDLRTRLRTLIKYQDGLCFLRLEKDQLQEMGITSNDAKNMIAEFGSVREFKIWAVVADNGKGGLYDGSLRSKDGYLVNGIASRHHGGGHDQAAGIKDLTAEEVLLLKEELLAEIKRVESAL